MMCGRCGQETLVECDGSGYVVVDASKNIVKECPRLYLKRLTDHLTEQMGAEIVRVKHVKNSPLHKLGEPGEPVVADLTQKNIIIRNTSWGAFLAHLKWALVCRGLDFTCKKVTDLNLLDVYLGKMSYKQRPAGKRDLVDVYNQLEDFLMDHDLVIVRLGQLGYKNQAAPGVLKEALMIRANLNKPTWLVDDPEYPWVASNDPAVEDYVRNHFESVVLDDADPGIDIRGGIVIDEEDDSPPKRASRVEATSTDKDLDFPGEGQRKKSSRNGWKRPRGGGPVS